MRSTSSSGSMEWDEEAQREIGAEGGCLRLLLGGVLCTSFGHLASLEALGESP